MAAFAALVSGTAGFGFGVVAMSVLPLFLGVKLLNPAITILSFGNSASVLAQGRKHVRWRPLVPLFIGAAVGIPLGVVSLGWLDEKIARRVLGAVLAAYVVYNLVPVPRRERALHPAWGAAFGLVSGMLGGAFSMSGPPVVIYFTLRGMEKDEMRSSLSAYFVMTALYKIPILAVNGFFTAEALRVILLMLIPTIVGTVGGQFLATRISNRVFQRVLLALLAATAVTYLAGG